MSKDPYKILGIPRSSSEAQIRAAYRTLAKKYHPDAGAGSSEEKFREIREAYETLADPSARAAYDAASGRRSPVSTPFDGEWHPIRRERSSRGDPSHIDLRNITARPMPEPIAARRSGAVFRTQYGQMSPWDDLEELLQFLELLDDRDW